VLASGTRRQIWPISRLGLIEGTALDERPVEARMTASNYERFHVLEGLLTDVLKLKDKGAEQQRLGHAQGLADGYMRCLLESHLATQRELLEVVGRTRAAFYGSPTREARRDPLQESGPSLVASVANRAA
jgi:hypothetical protein